MKPLQALGLLAIAGLPLSAQKPVINPGGIVNAASFQPWDQPGHLLAPGSIAAIFGQNLASGTVVATSVPLPTTLGGARVIVNGSPAPLFFVSPGQINFQVPSSAKQDQTIVVTASAGTSDPVITDGNVATIGSNFALFTQNASGCGQGAILNLNPDGSASVNSPSNSAAPGNYLAFFGTGAGPYATLPPDGALSPDSPLFPCCKGDFQIRGATIGGKNVPGLFFGRAPGQIGVDQVNVMVPVDAVEGCSVRLQAGAHPVAVSIHADGGECVDPPNAHSKAEILLEKSVLLNDPAVPESDVFFASFTASPHDFSCGDSGDFFLCSWPSTPNPPSPSDWLARDVTSPPPCPTPEYTKLDAGTLVVTAANVPLANVTTSLIGGAVGYKAFLPPGSIKAGDVAISTNGSKDVGPFATGFRVGAEIKVTSTFPKGTKLQAQSGLNLPPPPPLVVNWTGGEAGEVVSLVVTERDWIASGDYTHVIAQAPATAGSITINPMCVGFASRVCSMPWSSSSRGLDLIVSVGPDPAALTTFQAPGLTLAGLAGWAYEYRFTGLKTQ